MFFLDAQVITGHVTTKSNMPTGWRRLSKRWGISMRAWSSSIWWISISSTGTGTTVEGYAGSAIEEFDEWLPGFQAAMRPDDLGDSDRRPRL